MKGWIFCVLALVGLGCAQKREYQVVVHNRLDVPVTVGLIKDGPPAEVNWLTPEQWSMTGPRDVVGPWGMLIPPGKTADTPLVAGHFDRGVEAQLRIYRGEHSNSVLMAISEGSEDRATVTLLPGHNEIVVLPGQGSAMTVRRVGQ
jgi:hypothetical protein